MGGAGRAADHRALERLRDPGRGRGRQHPGPDVHRRRRVHRPDATSSTTSAATTCCRASSTARPSTARRTPCRTTPARSTSSTARTCSRRPASRCRPRWRSSSQAAIDLKAANPKPANFSGFWFPGQDWRNGAAFIWDAGGDLAVQDGDEWVGNLSRPESVAGLETVQQLFERGLRCAQGRQRGGPADPVLQQRDRHDVDARLGHRPDQRPRDRLPRHDEERRRLRAAGLRRLAGAGAARRLGHRDRRPSPPNQDLAAQGGRADAQRRVPDDPRRERPHPGQDLARAAAR